MGSLGSLCRNGSQKGQGASWRTEPGSVRRTGVLVQLGTRTLDHVLPFRQIALDRLAEFFRRTAGRLVADHSEALLERRRLDRTIDRGVELLDDRLRQSRGRNNAAPGRRAVARHA